MKNRCSRISFAVASMILVLASCETATEPGHAPEPPSGQSTATIVVQDTIRFTSFADQISPSVQARFGKGTRVQNDSIRWIIEDTTIVKEAPYQPNGRFSPGLPGITRLIAQVNDGTSVLAADTVVAIVAPRVTRLLVYDYGIEVGEVFRPGLALVDQDENLLYSGFVTDEFRSQLEWRTADPSIAAVRSAGTVEGIETGLTEVRVAWNDSIVGAGKLAVERILSGTIEPINIGPSVGVGFTRSYRYEGGDILELERFMEKGPNRWIRVNVSDYVGEEPAWVSRPDTVPATSDGVWFRVESDQSLRAYRPDGTELWRIDYLPGYLTLAGDRLIVRHKFQHMISAVSIHDGSLLWKTENPALRGSNAAFVTRSGEVVAAGNHVNFFDLETGQSLGRTRKGSYGMILLDDHLFMINSMTLSVIDLADTRAEQ